MTARGGRAGAVAGGCLGQWAAVLLLLLGVSACAAGGGGPVPEAAFDPRSGQGAAAVVQAYYELIGDHNYGDAWRLWGEGGRTSGMSESAFADSFSQYSAYHAIVGTPGRVDAGAGQRYVTVPVQVHGRMRDGQAFDMHGEVTLHRTADIDGATAAQKRWHIRTITLEP